MTKPWGKARDFITFKDAPYSGGPSLRALCRTPLTPTAHHFVRNHAEVPKLDPLTYELRVEGLVRKARTFTLAHLRGMHKERAAVAIECAGNRRAELNAVEH